MADKTYEVFVTGKFGAQLTYVGKLNKDGTIPRRWRKYLYKQFIKENWANAVEKCDVDYLRWTAREYK
jgi:hypothetical protein